ncbi:MAG: hypothetical protein BGO37_07425 [Cellulomonas sp. 73-92]|nr:MAG: hypothetical protein BGO37_07425 [Cellulomonas sp. 73-92]
MPGADLQWQLVGDDGLMVDLPGADAVGRAGAALRAAPPAGVVDVIPAARTVLVRGSSHGRDRWAAEARALVEVAVGAAQVDASSSAVSSGPLGRLVEIPVLYDGADLADVARLAGLTEAEVVARHAAARYRVAFGGFMPGFAYLVGLDPALVVPRLATPRTRVPAGAVAIAGEYAAVYPRATPGGWRLLGRTDVVMFDAAHDERPALLAPGDAVLFVPARDRVVAVGPPGGRTTRETSGAATGLGQAHRQVPGRAGASAAPAGSPASGAPGGGLATTDPLPSAGLEVLATGPLVLVEDAGRPGLAAVGVPRSGAADLTALRTVNRLVGNRADAAVLEVVLGGLVVRFGTTTAFALVGASAEAELDGRPVPTGRAVRAPAGATLALGVPRTGLRTWLAVRGGLDVPAVLGSRSTDVLSALGPAPVTVGEVLRLGRAFEGLPEPSAPGDGAGVAAGEPDPGSTGSRAPGTDPAGAPDVVVLPATSGPRIDRLADESRVRLVDQEWVVTASSNRVALRLDGPPVTRADDDELPSEGLVLGAVQVPHDGRPVVFGPDHPVTGGYPVVAVLTAEGITRAAQCRAGDRVRLAVGPL